jgi:hypothetical protein
MPIGIWLRVRVAEQDNRPEQYCWIGDVVGPIPAPPEHLFQQLGDSSKGMLQVAGVAVVGCRLPDGELLLHSPCLGRIRLNPSVLAGKKPPQPLVVVHFEATIIGDKTVESRGDHFIKFRATKLSPYTGPKEDFGVQVHRCLGKEAREIGDDSFGFVVEGQPQLKIKVHGWTATGETLKDMCNKAYLVYAVPRPYMPKDIPGAPRPCEWESLLVRESPDPPTPLDPVCYQDSQSFQPLRPQQW